MNLETKLQDKARARFLALSDEMQQAVRRAYERHLKACREFGVGPDPQCIFELISEAEQGRK